MKRATLLILLCLFLANAGAADKKKEPDKSSPQILLTAPLGVARGETIKLLLRGTGLSEASEVRVEVGERTLAAQIKSKSKSPAAEPLQVKKVGDTQVEIEFELPADAPAGDANIVIVTPEGATQPHALRVFDPTESVTEKEPNGGFRNAQEINLPTTVRGMIGDPNDVDVFRFVGKKGQRLSAEVIADRLNSPLDSLLTVYDQAGHLLATNDDSAAGSDSLLHLTLAADGIYFVTLVDANGRGGPFYAYLLKIGVE